MKSNQPQEKVYNFNIIILGNYQVGKTAILQRLCNDVYESEKLKVTHGVAFLTKELTVNGEKVVLNIRDTAGDERYQSLMKMYYHELHGAVIVYDITNKSSIDKLKYWIDDLDINGNSMERRIMLGNKSDMDNCRQITQLEGKTLATSRDMEWVECSAKTGDGIMQVFENLVKRMIQEYDTNADYKKIGVSETFITLSSVCPATEEKVRKGTGKKGKGKKSGCC